MLKMAVGVTDEIDGRRAAADLLAMCEADLGDLEPRAGLVLAAHDVEAPELLEAIVEAYPDIALIGTTTLAPMSSAGGYAEGATTLTLFASDVVDFTTGLGTGVSTGVDDASRAAVTEARAGTDKQPALAIVLPSVEALDAATICDEVGRALGAEVPVVGGGSVPDFPMTSPWIGGRQFRGAEVHTDALPLLLLSGPLHVSVGVRHGWIPVGRSAVVTRAEHETVFEIDGEPVTEFFRHYFDVDGTGAPATPLAILDPESDRHYLRAPLDWDLEEGSVRCHGSVPENAAVQIAMASSDQILDGTRASVHDAMAGFPASATPEAALVFSCAVRNFLLGSRAHAEIDLLVEGVGPTVPVSGLYAYGEFSPLQRAGATRMHNETCVTVLLGT